MAKGKENEEFKFEVINDYGVIGDGKWPKHFTKVSWNGGEPKYDIRPWNEDLSKMSKGISLTTEELMTLGNLIQKVLYKDEETE